MNNNKICPDCNAENHLTEISCNSCGAPLITASENNANQDPLSPPQFAKNKKAKSGHQSLEVSNMKAWYAAGEYIAFTFRIYNAPTNTSVITAKYSGLLGEGLSSTFIKTKEDNVYTDSFQGHCIPSEGGNIFLKLEITFLATDQSKHIFNASFMIDAISANANQPAMIKDRINSTVMQIENDHGIIDLDSVELPQGVAMTIKNKAGIINMENVKSLLQQGKHILREEVEMHFISIKKAVFHTIGKIIFQSSSHVKTTHLLALPEIILGRATKDKPVNIDLKCFPDNEENQRRASRISRHHCKIRQNRKSFEICDLSLWGTYLNKQRLEKEHWYKIAENDIIQIADINLTNQQLTGTLQLKAVLLPHALLLERLDNAPEEENYLMMIANEKPAKQEAFEPPFFFHHQGGFYCYLEADSTQQLRPDQTLTIGRLKLAFQEI